MDRELEHELALFGSQVRLFAGEPAAGGADAAELASLEAEATLRAIHSRLTRFDPASELCRLNANPDPVVGVSPLMMRFLEAAAEAAQASGGLVDATLIGPIEAAGYRKSRAGVEPADLRAALCVAPSRHPAGPGAASPWADVVLDRDEMTVTRPPGARFDSGGIGKGLAADLAGARLRELSSYAVDCCGDLRIGGAAALARTVVVTPPWPGARTPQFEVTGGGVATSGLRTRVWDRGSGFAHHLIDPATGQPAWTGIVQATALAPTAVGAEVLAKQALLSGPEGGRAALERFGGILIGEDGGIEIVGAATDVASGPVGAPA